MKNVKSKIATTMVLSLTLASANQASASIPPHDQCIDLQVVAVVKPYENPILTKENIAKFAPAALTPTTDQDALAAQFKTGVGQKITDSIFNGDTFRKTSLGKFTTDVEKAAKTSVNLGSATPGGVVQKVNFNVKAIQRQAEIAYTGYFNSNIVYDMNTNNMVTVISKPLAKATTLSLSNSSPMGQFNNQGMLSLTHVF